MLRTLKCIYPSFYSVISLYFKHFDIIEYYLIISKALCLIYVVSLKVSWYFLTFKSGGIKNTKILVNWLILVEEIFNFIVTVPSGEFKIPLL